MPETARANAQQLLSHALHHYANADTAALNARLAALDREWDVERALEAHAALAGLAAVAVTAARGVAWSWLPAAVFGVVLQQALLGWSPPVRLLRRLGFRTRGEIAQEVMALTYLRGDFQDALTAPPLQESAIDTPPGGRAGAAAGTSWRKKFRSVRTGVGERQVRAGSVVAGDVHAENFIEHVKSKWQPSGEDQLDKALRAVLAHLKWRLSSGQAGPLFEHLPRTIAKAAESEAPRGFALGEPPKTRVDADEFFGDISNATGLNRSEVEKATLAIFSSMKRNLPAAQNRAMRAMLPRGLKRVWLRA
jgi:uncharacterized protein (DUF2267 family)